MKLLIYSHFFAPSIGGVELHAMLLATQLSTPGPQMNEGAQVTLVTDTLADGFSDSSLPFSVVRRPRLLRLLRLVRQASVVHVEGPCIAPMLIAWILRKPFIVEHHGYQSICPNGLLFIESSKHVCPGHFMAGHHAQCLKCNSNMGTTRSLKMWLLTFLRRWLCSRATTNVSVSHHVQKRVQLRNSLTIYNGTPAIARDEINDRSTSKPPCFAYVGRLVTEKGVDVLLDAAAQLKADGVQFHLKIIGDGPERQNLQRFAADRNLNDRVTFAGFLTGEELHDAMEDVSVVIMPSRWEEAAPFSAIEEMWRGRLVICSDIGGLGEIVDGAGLKFAAGDAAALAERMRKVVQNPEIMNELGQQGRDRALRLFTFDRMISDHVALYRNIIASKLPGSEPAAEIQ